VAFKILNKEVRKEGRKNGEEGSEGGEGGREGVREEGEGGSDFAPARPAKTWR